MAVSQGYLDALYKLMAIAEEPCNGEFQCRHCYAVQTLDDIYTLLTEKLEMIESDCK